MFSPLYGLTLMVSLNGKEQNQGKTFPLLSSSLHGPYVDLSWSAAGAEAMLRGGRCTHLQKGRVHMGHYVGQPPPLTDGQAAGHFHEALDETKLLLFRVADRQVSAVHVDFPCHLFWATYFYLQSKIV